MFAYELRDPSKPDYDTDSHCFMARYLRSKKDPKVWRMQIVLPRDRDCDSQVYTFDYILPREGIDLCTIAAIGLKYFQMKLKEEIQSKSNFDFTIGELLKDM